MTACRVLVLGRPVADGLFVTVGAAEYVSTIFTKLGLPNTRGESRRVHAVLLFLRN